MLALVSMMLSLVHSVKDQHYLLRRELQYYVPDTPPQAAPVVGASLDGAAGAP